MTRRPRTGGQVTIGGSDYRIVRSLGVGSMGEVFLVENLARSRLEALKILRVDATHNAAVVTRFRREGRALERLQHPNVVTVYGHGELADHGLYLTMEYASGPDLECALATVPRFPPGRAIRVLEQLAAAIDHTHERGVVHRDLKPGNLILVRRDAHEVLKVMDFGIAKIFAVDYEGTSATSQGVCFGTPQYMAPEQFGDGQGDPRIDIYALGCIGYELVTGRPPFEGTVSELFQAHMRATPRRPSQRVPDIPRALDDVIMTCLEKRPQNRFPRGRDIIDALRGLARPGWKLPARAGTVTDDDADTRIEHRSSTCEVTQVGSASARPTEHDCQFLLVELGKTLVELDGPGSALAASLGHYMQLTGSLERWRAHERELYLRQGEAPTGSSLTEMQIASAATAARMEEAVQAASDELYAALTRTAERYLAIEQIAVSVRRLGDARSALRR